MLARICTEKVVVDGIKCRKIIGFEGIELEKDLPRECFSDKHLWFYLSDIDDECGCFRIRDGEQTWFKRADINCSKMTRADMYFPNHGLELNGYSFSGLTNCDIWTEENFRKILEGMKIAGNRLAAIRRKEKENWKGEETFTI